ncbi:hypothetical protein TcYC6_0074270 [Trypanosoma cruzi]|uniref:Uncharacterized protein n=1 Tax=Trypanosoma cruzi TaxID=5693 RepID=A0A7J6Y9Y0_TRYCR|nr:hypothetical protein ECC02_003652 [Trypanosoma cruzi]KAF8298724.1 hypothetical protein TcYC6_0074270 [Trypanosoma cruzi]
MSYWATSEGRALSAGHTSRLSWCMRSGAMAISRSAMTQTELLRDRIVDVGEGVVANFFEQLLARLEQHGIRRCLHDDKETYEDGTNNGDKNLHHIISLSDECSMASSLRPSVKQRMEDAREPYYYVCVPCELQLTETSTSAATLAMLQDVHYHCSSAEHRRIASWMGEPDIDRTLQNSAKIDPTGYAWIHVNGIPMLIPRRPGGGDMFFPLPHEAHNQERIAPSGMDGLLFATQQHTEVWNRPLRSIYTGTKQFLYTVDNNRRICKKKWKTLKRRRNRFVLQHIPLDVYTTGTFVGDATVPALFEITQQRLPKKAQYGAETTGYRMKYVVSDKPCMVWNDAMETGLSSFVVRNNGIYRVSLLCAGDAAKWASQGPPPAGSTQDAHTGGEGHSQMLTVEALSQLRAASTVGRNFHVLSTSELDASDSLNHSEVTSYVSS